TDAVAGFGVGARIEAFSLMIVFALSSTLPMFIGQNLGAEKPHRVWQALTVSFRFVLGLQFAIYLLLVVSAPAIAALFSDEQAVQDTIITFLWIVPLSHGLSGIVVLINVSMNVLGRPALALYINLARLFLIYLPLAYLGSLALGLEGLFLGIALGNCVTYLLAELLLNRTLRELRIYQQPELAASSNMASP
ncbi:MAG: hypothetical protein KJP04_08465, partial [Arenicella sp.]|nr:hypothetical protein [Arenicella sp.]